MKLPELIHDRRASTDQRLKKLISALNTAGALEIARGCACVYATGSGGRGEMSAQSDLDIFVLRDRTVERPLTNLNEIRLKARLIEISRKEGFDDFSSDGKYVKAHDINDDLVGKLGNHEDDYANIFTARMLLLLESRPIVEPDMYERAIGSVIAKYWRDFPQNSTAFLPIFLMNDILRFWKTLCLNYEERTGDAKTGKRRLLNYKLKHSRLLTCYSAVLFLMTKHKIENGTVSPEAAIEMTRLSPTQRLEFIAEKTPEVAAQIESILEHYAAFLQTCDADKSRLEEQFSTPEFKKAKISEAKHFGDEVFGLLDLVGKGTDLFRYLVV